MLESLKEVYPEMKFDVATLGNAQDRTELFLGPNTASVIDPYTNLPPGYHHLRALLWDDPAGRARLLSKLPEVSCARSILEIGAGTGALAQALADRSDGGIWCIDRSAYMIAQGRRFASSCHWIYADATQPLPLPAGSMDVAITAMMLHQVENKNALAIEIRRVLKRNGTWVVCTALPEDLEGFFLYRICSNLLEKELDRFPSAESIDRLALSWGFRKLGRPLKRDPSLAIPFHAFQEAIGQRFVSILQPLPQGELEDIKARLISVYLSGRMISVPTYSCHVLRFGKL